MPEDGRASVIAPVDTLLGLLQRGRGEGYRRIIDAPKSEAHALLTQCIVRDPRLDSQVESREAFYASIAIDIGLPLEPLVEHLRNHDDESQDPWATPLTVRTLAELAKRHYENAAAILCDYIKWGQWWDWPLGDLLDLGEQSVISHVIDAIEERFPDEEGLDAAVRDLPEEAAFKLSEFSTRIKAALAKIPADSDETAATLPSLHGLSSQDIVSLADRKNLRVLCRAVVDTVKLDEVEMLASYISLEKPFHACVALAGLTQLAPVSLGERLLDMWMQLPDRNAVRDQSNRVGQTLLRLALERAILALPSPTTVPLARVWFIEKEGPKRDIAEKLLQEHATAEDLPALRAALAPLFESEEAEWDCFIVKAFHRLPDAGFVPELLDIFYRFRFSRGRAYAAKAIQITSPRFFVQNIAVECLWDCEEETRRLGVQYAPWDSDAVRSRIRCLADDVLEDVEVRDAAKERLKNAPWAAS